MNNVRLQICTGLFRSASNLESFENMLSILARSARTQGPEDALAAPAASAAIAGPGAQAARGASGGGVAVAPEPEPQLSEGNVIRRDTPKVGRNDLCPAAAARSTSTVTAREHRSRVRQFHRKIGKNGKGNQRSLRYPRAAVGTAARYGLGRSCLRAHRPADGGVLPPPSTPRRSPTPSPPRPSSGPTAGRRAGSTSGPCSPPRPWLGRSSCAGSAT